MLVSGIWCSYSIYQQGLMVYVNQQHLFWIWCMIMKKLVDWMHLNMVKVLKHDRIHQKFHKQRSCTGPVLILLCSMCMCECVCPVAVLMKAHWHPDHIACSHWGTSLINTDIIRVPLWPFQAFQGLCCWHQNWCQLFQISCIFIMNKYCLKWLMIMFSWNVIKRTKGRCALNGLFLLSISFDDGCILMWLNFILYNYLSWAFGYWPIIHKMIETDLLSK